MGLLVNESNWIYRRLFLVFVTFIEILGIGYIIYFNLDNRSAETYITYSTISLVLNVLIYTFGAVMSDADEERAKEEVSDLPYIKFTKWRYRVTYMYLISFVFICMSMYPVYKEYNSKVSEISVMMGLLGISFIVGGYVFGQNLDMKNLIVQKITRKLK